MKQKINVVDPVTGKRCIGVYDERSGRVTLLGGILYGIAFLATFGTIYFFERYHKGKQVKERKWNG